jgi:hypothetical protein
MKEINDKSSKGSDRPLFYIKEILYIIDER